MDEQRARLKFITRDELHSTPIGRALWQSVRRPRRHRLVAAQATEPLGPYEVTYPVSTGYPDREVVLP